MADTAALSFFEGDLSKTLEAMARSGGQFNSLSEEDQAIFLNISLLTANSHTVQDKLKAIKTEVEKDSSKAKNVDEIASRIAKAIYTTLKANQSELGKLTAKLSNPTKVLLNTGNITFSTDQAVIKMTGVTEKDGTLSVDTTSDSYKAIVAELNKDPFLVKLKQAPQPSPSPPSPPPTPAGESQDVKQFQTKLALSSDIIGLDERGYAHGTIRERYATLLTRTASMIDGGTGATREKRKAQIEAVRTELEKAVTDNQTKHQAFLAEEKNQKKLADYREALDKSRDDLEKAHLKYTELMEKTALEIESIKRKIEDEYKKEKRDSNYRANISAITADMTSFEGSIARLKEQRDNLDKIVADAKQPLNDFNALIDAQNKRIEGLAWREREDAERAKAEEKLNERRVAEKQASDFNKAIGDTLATGSVSALASHLNSNRSASHDLTPAKLLFGLSASRGRGETENPAYTKSIASITSLLNKAAEKNSAARDFIAGREEQIATAIQQAQAEALEAELKNLNKQGGNPWTGDTGVTGIQEVSENVAKAVAKKLQGFVRQEPAGNKDAEVIAHLTGVGGVGVDPGSPYGANLKGFYNAILVQTHGNEEARTSFLANSKSLADEKIQRNAQRQADISSGRSFSLLAFYNASLQGGAGNFDFEALPDAIVAKAASLGVTVTRDQAQIALEQAIVPTIQEITQKYGDYLNHPNSLNSRQILAIAAEAGSIANERLARLGTGQIGALASPEARDLLTGINGGQDGSTLSVASMTAAMFAARSGTYEAQKQMQKRALRGAVKEGPLSDEDIANGLAGRVPPQVSNAMMEANRHRDEGWWQWIKDLFSALCACFSTGDWNFSKHMANIKEDRFTQRFYANLQRIPRHELVSDAGYQFTPGEMGNYALTLVHEHRAGIDPNQSTASYFALRQQLQPQHLTFSGQYGGAQAPGSVQQQGGGMVLRADQLPGLSPAQITGSAAQIWQAAGGNTSEKPLYRASDDGLSVVPLSALDAPTRQQVSAIWSSGKVPVWHDANGDLGMEGESIKPIAHVNIQNAAQKAGGVQVVSVT